MAKRLLFILFFCAVIVFCAQSQAVVYINAGSRALTGTTQDLVIFNNGQCRYVLSEVDGTVKDSSSFSITKQQLDSFFVKASQVGFFNLNNKYESNLADGAGIYISIDKNGQVKAVQLHNTDVSAVNELITWLNRILVPHKILINYGQFVKINR